MPDDRLLTRRGLVALISILCLGSACRLFLTAQSPAFIIHGDTASYMAPAAALADDGTFTIGYKRPPVYPLFLAGIAALGGPSYEVAALAQHALGLVVVVLVYLLGALAFGRVTGLLAALGVAGSSAVLRMEHTVASESVFAVLLLGSLLCMLLLTRRRGAQDGVALDRRAGLLLLLTGTLVGLLALTRPTGQVVLVLAAGIVLLARGAWRARVLAVGLLGLGYGLVMGPWLLRNFTAHGVATAAGGLGDSLYVRVRLHDPTFDFRDHGAPPSDPRHAEIRATTFELAENYQRRRGGELRRSLMERLDLTEAESDDALTDAALVVIRQEPLRYLGGTVEMFLRLGLDQGSEHPLDEDWDTRVDRRAIAEFPRELRTRLAAERPPPESRARVEQLLGFNRDRHAGLLVVMLFMLGTVSCVWRAERREAIVLPLVVLIHLLVYAALDGPLTRYRYPVQPLITLVAAGGLTWLGSLLVGGLHERTGRRVPVGLRSAEPEPVAGRPGILPGWPAAAPGQPRD